MAGRRVPASSAGLPTERLGETVEHNAMDEQDEREREEEEDGLPQPPSADLLEHIEALEERMAQLERERSALIVEAYDKIAHDESHLAPYRQQIEALDTLKVTVQRRVEVYNCAINELRAHIQRAKGASDAA